MKPLFELALLLTLALALGSCTEPYSVFADPSPSVRLANALLPLPERVYRGTCSGNFELSVFKPCGSAELWWIDGGRPDAFGLINAVFARLDSHLSQRLFVVWRGRPSHRGTYGHMGCCEREFHVSEVLLVRPARSDDCRQ